MFYHIPEKAIRCLNRSYRINNQPIICEALAGAYYHLAIRDALAQEKECIAIIGGPYTGEDLLNTFFADILRPTQIFI